MACGPCLEVRTHFFAASRRLNVSGAAQAVHRAVQINAEKYIDARLPPAVKEALRRARLNSSLWRPSP